MKKELRSSKTSASPYPHACAPSEEQVFGGDALLKVKEYAWEGFSQFHAGNRETFEQLWAEAFDDLFHVRNGVGFC